MPNANTNLTPQARVRLPNGRYSYVPVWLPVRGTRAQRTLALHMPTLGAHTPRRVHRAHA